MKRENSLKNWTDFLFKFNNNFYLRIDGKEYNIKNPKRLFILQKRIINKNAEEAYNDMDFFLISSPKHIEGYQYLGRDFICEVESSLIWLTVFSFYNPLDNLRGFDDEKRN